MQKKLALVASVVVSVTVLIGGYGKTKTWAQGQIKQQVQREVGQKIDAQGEVLERLMCATYYGKPQQVCDCESVERRQAADGGREPTYSRCETIGRLLEAGRPEAAAVVAADST